MFKKVFYFLKGYVIIKVEGNFPERFLNVAGRRNLLMWQVRPVADGIILHAPMGVYEKIRVIAKDTDCTVKLLKKVGLSNTVKSHSNRKAFLPGLACFLLLVFGLLSLLWNVEITGIERISEQTILTQLKQNGIHRFAFVYGIDKKQAIKNIVAQNKDIAWLGIEIKGSCAYVEVVETVERPEIQDKSVPCNLISDKDGVVTALEIESGITMVKIGDTVTKGQLLVSGISDSPSKGVRFLHAEGEVYIKTWHEKNLVVPLEQDNVRKTGQSKKHYTVQLYGFTVPVWFNQKHGFKSAEQTVSYYGPIKCTKYEELILEKVQCTPEQVLEAELETFKQELSEKGIVENISHTTHKENNNLHIRFIAELTEKTGVKRMIERETDGENFAD